MSTRISEQRKRANIVRVESFETAELSSDRHRRHRLHRLKNPNLKNLSTSSSTLENEIITACDVEETNQLHSQDDYLIGSSRLTQLVARTQSKANDMGTTTATVILSDKIAEGVTDVGKLEASAAIVLDAMVPDQRMIKKRTKQRSTTPAASTVSFSMIHGGWKIKYQDFLSTTDKNEPFDKLVEMANEWLKKNSDFGVKTCETITWMSHDHKTLENGEQMMLSKRIVEHSYNYNMRGLRLWLIARTNAKPQQISVLDFVPTNFDDTIASLVANVNAHVEQGRIKGQILTIETVSIPCMKQKLDSGITRWTDFSDEDSTYVFGLRLFCNREVNGRIYGSDSAMIGLKDMVPLPADGSYEGFEDLIGRTNIWLSEQCDVLVTNLQSIMVQKSNGPHSETGSSCHYSLPGINRLIPVDYFRILRIAYLKPVGELLVDLPSIVPLTFETFTPGMVKQKDLGIYRKDRLEQMKETFSRASEFLQNSGAELVCAETVVNPVQLYQHDDASLLPRSDEIKFLLTIRLFLTWKRENKPDGNTRSNRRASVVSASKAATPDDEGNDHPGPIFLRHVVSRRFKYRWLVLAATAITCMTIIVVVSVVYSNLH